jgi:hypothetical protein
MHFSDLRQLNEEVHEKIWREKIYVSKPSMRKPKCKPPMVIFSPSVIAYVLFALLVTGLLAGVYLAK